MQRTQIKRLLTASVPLISLSALILIFSYAARTYVRCEAGNCDGIGQNIHQFLVRDDPSTREPISGESPELAQKRETLKTERAASIYAGRLTFILIAITNLLTCTMAGVIACFVFIRSVAQSINHPTRWLFLAIALSVGVGLLQTIKPDTMGIAGPVFQQTISTDIPPIKEILMTLTAFGHAVIAFLTLTVCAIVFVSSGSSTSGELERLSLRMKHLQLVLYVSTLMLVAAALLMKAVGHWSLAFVPPHGKLGATTLFTGLITIEGGFLTLVLATAYLPAAFILQTRAESLPELPEALPDREKKLKDYDLAFSLPQSLPRIAAILGPVLVGPIGEVVSRLG